MKQPWWALLIVAVFGLGAGVGIGTFLGSESSDASAVGGDVATASTAADSTVAPVTTEPDPATTTSTTTTTSTSTTTTTTTPASTTSTTVAATTVPPEPVAPAITDLPIVVANGAGVEGIASSTADLLTSLGYTNVVIADGADVFGATVFYVADGLDGVAERVLTDIQVIDPGFAEPAFVVPLAGAPELTPPFPDAALVVYLGEDQR